MAIPGSLALRRRLAPLVISLVLVPLLGLSWPASRASAQGPTGFTTFPDFPIDDGHYFSQAAGGDPASGFTITDDGGIPFWGAFRSLGGVDAIGYPATGRFTWLGFVDQATQKAILQWNPAAQRVDIVNVFDVLAQLGLDPWLLAHEQVPPSFDNRDDAGKSWAQIVARHQAELDWNPAIKARYFADPDPLAHFGLPQSYADEGNVLVVRCQRAVFQQWKVDVPWAKAGEVTVANGGDIAKAAGILPDGTATPVAAAGLIATPFGAPIALTAHGEQEVRAAAAALRRSLVLIHTRVPSGGDFFGSGMVIDATGDILTDAHVVAGVASADVLLPDGRRLVGQVVGHDTLADVAVLHVAATGLTPIVPAASAGERPLDPLVLVGYTPYFPSPPAVRVGQVLDLETNQYYSNVEVNILEDDLAAEPGDSGSPIANLRGQVVAIVNLVGFAPLGQRRISFSVDNAIDGVLPIARQIIATGRSIIRPLAGFDAILWKPALAQRLGLPYVGGLLVTRVDAGSEAARAGIQAGDVVTSIGGASAASVGGLGSLMAHQQPGDTVSVTWVDRQGAAHAARITLSGE